MTWVKICGLTNVDDAVYTADAGANALGFIFFDKSPRSLTVDKAKEIIDCLPKDVLKVAVFVNPTYAYVRSIIEQLSIDLLQFHGSENLTFSNQFKCPFIKAISVSDSPPNKKLEQAAGFNTSNNTYGYALLFDAVKTETMEKGQLFDWGSLPDRNNLTLPMILAGGLNHENVRNALLQVRPWGIDVSSGVEISPGKKDLSKVKKLLDEVRTYDNEQ